MLGLTFITTLLTTLLFIAGSLAAPTHHKRCKSPSSSTTPAAKSKPSPASTASHSASTSTPKVASPAPVANVANSPKPQSSPKAQSQSQPSQPTGSRLDQIKSMYAFEGFTYDLEGCKSQSQITSDFKAMKATGARVVLSTIYCDSQDNEGYYAGVISAAQSAGLDIIPLVWTLPLGDGQNFQNSVVPRINAITKAVIANPGPVLAVALGDEPLFDSDFGSPSSLASSINNMKSSFNDAGLSIPVSISDLAFGWQNAGDISPVADAVDFFMINNFPFFAGNAQNGNSDSTWSNFKNDISYFQGIANGKPLLVTQTGWSSNKNLYPPNSGRIDVSTSSQGDYWSLLDSHCEDFFKVNKIGWMWRNWDDTMDGWGAMNSNGQPKFNVNARKTC